MSSAGPGISIIVPVLNEAAHLAQNLQQLRSLAPGCELLVVDGGSEDDSVAIAEALADQVLSAPKGRARQMNGGAKAASGQYLLFVHADTVLPLNFPCLVDGWLSLQPEWGFFPVRLSGDHWLLRVVEKAMNFRSRLSAIATGDQCLMVRRELFDQVDGFPDQPLMEDLALSKALKRIARPKMFAEPVETSSRRWQQKGVLKTIVQMWCLRLAYFLGVSPERLAAIYYPQQKGKYCYPDCCIVQFAKSPQLGKVKTRLRNVLGDEACLRLHKALATHQFNRLRLGAVAPLELWLSCREGLIFGKALVGVGNERLALQSGADLGQRMLHCFEDRLAHYHYVILVGSDCPAMTAAYVQRAIEALRGGADAVLGPATDGGYVLIGLRRSDPALFEDIPWGTDQVLQKTLNKLENLGWECQILSELIDIDRPEDLAGMPPLDGFSIADFSQKQANLLKYID